MAELVHTVTLSGREHCVARGRDRLGAHGGAERSRPPCVCDGRDHRVDRSRPPCGRWSRPGSCTRRRIILKRFLGGLVFEALRPLYHSTLGTSVIIKDEDTVILSGRDHRVAGGLHRVGAHSDGRDRVAGGRDRLRANSDAERSRPPAVSLKYEPASEPLQISVK